MRLHTLAAIATWLVVIAAGVGHAAPITFTGLTGAGQGLLGHAFVGAGATVLSSFYASHGVAGPYTRLVSPDAFDYVTGAELALGSGVPAHGFAATAAAPLGLEAIGITGSLHLSLAGLTLDYTNAADLFTTGLHQERRIYRNGSAAIFEEAAPGVYDTVAEFINLVMQVDIDYSTGAILSSATAERAVGTPPTFPEIWSGFSFGPIDVAGTTTENGPNSPYGAFSTSTTMDFNLEMAEVPEPGTFLLVGVGLGIAYQARRRRRY